MPNISWVSMVSNLCGNGLISNSKLLDTGCRLTSKISHVPSIYVQFSGKLELVNFLEMLLHENLKEFFIVFISDTKAERANTQIS